MDTQNTHQRSAASLANSNSTEEPEGKIVIKLQERVDLDMQKELQGATKIAVTLITESGETRQTQFFEGEAGPYECSTCGKTCKNSGALHTHMRSHEVGLIRDTRKDTFPFKCQICEKRYKTKRAYLRHLSSHGLFEKEDSPEGTREVLNLDDSDKEGNRKTNNGSSSGDCSGDGGEKEVAPYHCPLCNIVETQKDVFLAHIQSHTDRTRLSSNGNAADISTTGGRNLRTQNSFFCKYCDKEFESSGGLLLHKQVHEGNQKSFECPICSRLFINKGSLHSHLKAHKLLETMPYNNVEWSHECTICDKRFRLRGYLRKHIKKHHPELYDVGIYNVDDKIRKDGNGGPTPQKNENPKLAQAPLRPILPKPDHPNGQPVVFRPILPKSLLPGSTKALSTSANNSSSLLKCEFCGETMSKEALIEHRKTCPQQVFKCNWCRKIFKTKSSIDQHMANHGGDVLGRFKCTICSKMYDQEVDLQRHAVTHSHKKPYRCILCGQCFKHSMMYWTHMESRHPGKAKKSFDCEICMKSFGRSYILKKHMDTDHGDRNQHAETRTEKPCDSDVSGASSRHKVLQTDLHKVLPEKRVHFCSVCSKTFIKLSHLKRHLSVHAGKEKVMGVKTKKPKKARNVDPNSPFICSICKKVFAKAKGLRGHMISHKGETFKCDFCDKSFSRIFILKSHLKVIHKKVLVNSKKGLEGELIRLNFSNRVLFKCPVCGIVFIHHKELAGHMRIHTGQKPYECSYCAETFFGRFQLQDHLKAEHPQPTKHFLLPYRHKCTVCTKAFKKLSDLKRHLKVHAKHGHIILFQ